MPLTHQDIEATLLTSFKAGQVKDHPYKHWFLSDCLPKDVMRAVCDLPFPAPSLDGVSGKREVHNATRRYFDIENRRAHPVVESVAQTFQNPTISSTIANTFATNLDGSYLRIEFAQDIDGFWLEPHTDLGVKLFTCLLYLSDGPDQSELGTDIYDTEKRHVGRSPFAPNMAMVFVPSNLTYHGFEQRKISGVRKSLIINYVTEEWRAREQLAFPDEQIRH